MKFLPSRNGHSRRAGFTMVELLVVVAVVMLVAAASLPAISRYIRNYRIRSAMDQVSAEITRARTAAVMKNANPGVAFVIADNNTYRWIKEVPTLSAPPAEQIEYGPLRDLPQGVQFVAGGTAGFRFTNVGTWCRPGSANGECTPTLPGSTGQPPVCLESETASRCTDTPGNYVTITAGSATVPAVTTIVLVETRTGAQRRLRIDPGGRVRVDAR